MKRSLVNESIQPLVSKGLVWLLVMAVMLGVTGVACSDDGSERSVEAFCSTMRSEKKRILTQLESTSGSSSDDLAGVLAGLGASVQAIGELRTYFRKLERVAPSEIQTEVEIVSQAMDDQLKAAEDAIDNPIASLGSALLTGLTTSGQLQSVDDYARSNCGAGI